MRSRKPQRREGEGDVDQHNLALEVVVAGQEPVDQEGDEKTDQADHRTD